MSLLGVLFSHDFQATPSWEDKGIGGGDCQDLSWRCIFFPKNNTAGAFFGATFLNSTVVPKHWRVSIQAQHYSKHMKVYVFRSHLHLFLKLHWGKVCQTGCAPGLSERFFSGMIVQFLSWILLWSILHKRVSGWEVLILFSVECRAGASKSNMNWKRRMGNWNRPDCFWWGMSVQLLNCW